MRSTQRFFSRRLPTKIGNFEWQKALCAPQGFYVVTDEHSPFEWVGSYGAYPCIINLIHGVNVSGVKVAACGHLSATESPDSIRRILKTMKLSDVLSVYLVSGMTDLRDPVAQELYNVYQKAGVDSQLISYRARITQAAIHVKKGEVTHEPVFAEQTSRKRQRHEASHKFLQLAVDGRKSGDVKIVSKSLSELLKKDESADPDILQNFNGSVARLL